MKKIMKFIKRQAVKVRNRVALTKVFVGRASGWMSLINTAMIILVLLKVQDNPNLSKFTVPLILGWMCLLFFFGWFDIRVMKGTQAESERSFVLQPPLVRIGDNVLENRENLRDIVKILEERSVTTE